MKEMILVVYEGLTGFVPFLTAFFLLGKRRGTGKMPAMRIVTLTALAVYVIGALHFTGAGTLYDIMAYKLELREDKINLLPLSREIDVVSYGLNVVLLLPLGILLPVLWKEFRRVGNILLAGFSFSLLIELSQLLNNRSTDIDDLILNTAGAVLGWEVYHRLAGITGKEGFKGQYYKWEAALYIGVIFLGRFLLFNEIGMAGRLYGF